MWEDVFKLNILPCNLHILYCEKMCSNSIFYPVTFIFYIVRRCVQTQYSTLWPSYFILWEDVFKLNILPCNLHILCCEKMCSNSIFYLVAFIFYILRRCVKLKILHCNLHILYCEKMCSNSIFYLVTFIFYIVRRCVQTHYSTL